MFKKSVFVIFFLSSCSTINLKIPVNCDFPIHSPYPGGALNVEIAINKVEDISKIKANGKSVTLCASQSDSLKVIAPIPLTEKINKISLTEGKKILASVTLKERKYRESRIKIKNSNLVNPSKELLPRIRKESLIFKELKQSFQAVVNQSMAMDKPLDGINSSEFGVKRFINGSPRNRHTGLDIAAPEGSNVYLPLNGSVILNAEFFYRGNIIMIDHGNGYISSFSHLQTSFVTEGQKLKKGQLIGTVGKTGRVTGPHLHWEVSILGIPVNPEIFLEGNS